MFPAARTDKLTVQELADETLVFDHETGKAHCLNHTAGLVWKHCDGQTSPAELARRLEVPEAAVELALEQLHRRKLVEGSIETLSAERSRSRRDAIRKLAAAALLLPTIMTITAPAASAQTSAPPNPCQGQQNGFPCGNPQNFDCCQNNVCVPNGCQPS